MLFKARDCFGGATTASFKARIKPSVSHGTFANGRFGKVCIPCLLFDEGDDFFFDHS